MAAGRKSWLFNPLDWPLVDRCVLCSSIAFPWVVAGWLIVWKGSEATYFSDLVNWEFAEQILKPFYAITSIFMATVIVAGLLLRRRDPENPLVLHLFLQGTAVHTGLVIYFTGTITTPVWVVALGGLSISLLMFGLRPVLLSGLTALIILTGTTVAQIAGWIPYAPWLRRAPFEDGHLLIPPAGTVVIFLVPVTLSAAIILVSSYIFARWKEREEQVTELSGFLKKMFGRYLAPEVMHALIENPAALEMGGHRRRVSILMTDLRGFTALAERIPAETFVRMLNDYYEIMVEVVFRHHGTVNEIIGDALLVIFGAPHEMPDRALRATACAVEMQNAMAAVNQRNEANGLPALEMGIGINDAEVVVGNIGSSRRSKYTVVGSGVNMASRIESYTVGGQILASQSVIDESKGLIRIDGRMEIMPKGASHPLAIYEIGGVGGEFSCVLNRHTTTPRPPVRPLRFVASLVDGKTVNDDRFHLEIIAISAQAVTVRSDSKMETLSNLKLNLHEVSSHLDRLDIYAKVMPVSDGNSSGLHEIRFTSIPREVVAFIEGVTLPAS